MGGSFGVAIFGAIFSNVLAGNLARHLRGAPLPAGFTTRGITPALLARLPAAIHHAIAAAYADAIHTVFLIAVPIGAVAFAATLFIPRIELRTWPTVCLDPTYRAERVPAALCTALRPISMSRASALVARSPPRRSRSSRWVCSSASRSAV
jgi:hypothetical protein